MSIGPLNEIIVSVTNAIRRTPRGQVLFANSDVAEEAFDEWQALLLSTAEIVYNTWNDTNSDVCDRALNIFEHAFKAAVIPDYNKETI